MLVRLVDATGIVPVARISAITTGKKLVEGNQCCEQDSITSTYFHDE